MLFLLAASTASGDDVPAWDWGSEPFVYFEPQQWVEPCNMAPIFFLDDVGHVCQPDPSVRLYQVFDGPMTPSGYPGFLGYSHGVDNLPSLYNETGSGDPLRAYRLALGSWGTVAGHDNEFPAMDLHGARRAPHCADTDYTTRFYYVHASDDAALLPDALLRDYIHLANGLYYQTAMDYSGLPVDLRMECENGHVKIERLQLPTALASTDLASIALDIQALVPDGADPNIKHWILFDEQMCSHCDGASLWFPDDRPFDHNLNNGDRLPLYSVTYAQDQGHTLLGLLHGLTHMMGAVAYGLPGGPTGTYSDNAGNCILGFDIMCSHEADWHGYSPSPFHPDNCPVFTLSCEPMAYYHPGMPAPAYPHWNIGNTDNNFLAFGATTMDALECQESLAGLPTICIYEGGTDRPNGVRYHIDWDDGTTTSDPMSGSYTDPKFSAWDHVYTTPGTYTVKVQAQTTDGALSGWMPFEVTVG